MVRSEALIGNITWESQDTTLYYGLVRATLRTWSDPPPTPERPLSPSWGLYSMEWFIVIRDQSTFKLTITQGRDMSLLPVRFGRIWFISLGEAVVDMQSGQTDRGMNIFHSYRPALVYAGLKKRKHGEPSFLKYIWCFCVSTRITLSAKEQNSSFLRSCSVPHQSFLGTTDVVVKSKADSATFLNVKWKDAKLWAFTVEVSLFPHSICLEDMVLAYPYLHITFLPCHNYKSYKSPFSWELPLLWWGGCKIVCVCAAGLSQFHSVVLRYIQHLRPFEACEIHGSASVAPSCLYISTYRGN